MAFYFIDATTARMSAALTRLTALAASLRERGSHLSPVQTSIAAHCSAGIGSNERL
jgi:hypothetical protein